jgi:hypothetical protein
MESVECWRWRYRDHERDGVWRTTLPLTEAEAARYPAAERIEGSRCLREPGQAAGGPAEAFNEKSRRRAAAPARETVTDR